LHQVGTSSLLIYMMHGHTYIKLIFLFCCATTSNSHNGLTSEISIDYASIDTAACGKDNGRV